MPTGFHETVFERTEETMDLSGNPGNNLIAVTPDLQEVLNHPRVADTLSSILGTDYDLNAHHYCHRHDPGIERGYYLRQDGKSRHHHRTFWCMAYYYPQDTTPELGPTSVVPGSQYYNHEPDTEVSDEMPVCGAAAAVVPSLGTCLRHQNRYVRAKAALVLRRVATQEATETLIKYLTTARWCLTVERNREPFPGTKRQSLYAIVEKSALMTSLVEDDRIYRTVEALLGPGFYLIALRGNICTSATLTGTQWHARTSRQ